MIYSITVYSPRGSAYTETAPTLDAARKIATSAPANLWPVMIRRESVPMINPPGGYCIIEPVEMYERGTLAETF